MHWARSQADWNGYNSADDAVGGLLGVAIVADSVAGIPEAYRDRLLKPFLTTPADRAGYRPAIVDRVMRQYGRLG